MKDKPPTFAEARAKLLDLLDGLRSHEWDVRHMGRVHIEYEAWRQVCLQLTRLGIDINSQEPLACAVRLWGEELVALREGDPNPDHTGRSLDLRRAEYQKHVLPSEKS